MLPASFAAVVPVFIATPTSDWASAGASFVPSPVIATMRPRACSSRISSIFRSGVASARKSSTPDSSAITAAVTGLSPVIITVRMPIGAARRSARFMPPLTMSFRCTTPSTQLSWATTRGVPPDCATPCTMRVEFARRLSAVLCDEALDRVGGTLAEAAAVEIDAAHPRRGREGDELVLAELLLAEPEALLGEDDDRASLGRLVGERRELCGLREIELVDAADGQELGRLAIAERDRARLVQQEHVHVSRGLDCAARHGENVPLHEPVHSCDADGREQRADGRRDESDEKGDEHGLRERGVGVEGVRPQGHRPPPGR